MTHLRSAVLWASIAAAIGLFLWFTSLGHAPHVRQPGDTLRLLIVSLGTNLLIVGAYFGLVAIARTRGLVRGLDDVTLKGRLMLIAAGVLAALVGFSFGHLSIRFLWGADPGGWVRSALGPAVTGVPIVLSIVLVVGSFLSIGLRRIRSVRFRLGIVFLLTSLVAVFLLLPRFDTQIAIIMDNFWLNYFYPVRAHINTPPNDVTVVYVEAAASLRERNDDLLRALMAEGPSDIVVLSPVGVTYNDSLDRVEIIGIHDALSDPQAGTRLTIGYSQLWDDDRALLEERYPRTAFRKQMSRNAWMGGPTAFFSRVSTDPGDDLLAYLLSIWNVPVTASLRERSILVNLHGEPGRYFGSEPHFTTVTTSLYDGSVWRMTVYERGGRSPAGFSFAIDRATERFVSDDGRPGADSVLASLRGGRVIVDMMPQSATVWDSFLGVCYAMAIVNASHGLEFIRISGLWYAVGTIVVLVLMFVLFVRYRSGVALWTAMLIHGIIAAVLALVYLEWNILISPMPIFWSANGLVVTFLYLVTSARERRQAVEERTRLETELNAAREMQFSLMPARDPEIPGFDIAGVCQPANEVGGDFYDYVWLNKKKTKLGIAVADVSGKAMKAAMTAVMTSGMLYDAAQRSGSPKEILSSINTPLYLRSDKRVFTAMLMSTIDVKGTKAVTVSNAGQTPPLLVRNGTVTPLQAKGVKLPLGIKEALRYPQVRRALRPGDVMLFYTDGLTEAMSGAEMYGKERLHRFLTGNAGLAARQIVDLLLADVRDFSAGGPQSDDLTLVVVKVEKTARQ